jgi:hypothetical protein
MTYVLCSFCDKPIDIETAKTNEYGKAIQKACYVLKMQGRHSFDDLGYSRGFPPSLRPRRVRFAASYLLCPSSSKRPPWPARGRRVGSTNIPARRKLKQVGAKHDRLVLTFVVAFLAYGLEGSMSALDDKPARIWHAIATELLAAQEPDTMIQLTVDLVAAIDRDEANCNQRSEGSETRGNA